MAPRSLTIAAAWLLAAGPAFADNLTARMDRATPNGPGETIGTVMVMPTPGGAQFIVDLHGLPPGPHGFHVHENGRCTPTQVGGAVVPAGGAGGHFDPNHTGHHQGPEQQGHLGDLPVLTVDADGNAKTSILAPHIKDPATIRGLTVMIHAGGDNYSDEPLPLGGGGARIACGLLE